MDKELECLQEKNENIEISFEKKKHYSEPSVTALGSMQRLTLGGSTPVIDSGGGPGISTGF